MNEYPTIYNPKLSWHIMPSDTEYIIALKEQGVSNFDPIQYHKNKLLELELDNNNQENVILSKKERKEKKQSQKSVKFIEENNIRKENILREQENNQIANHLEKVEDDSIDTLSSKIRSMRTNYGRVNIKIKLLEYFMAKNLITASHLIFYSLLEEDDVDELQNMKSSVILRYKNRFSAEDMLSIQMKSLSSYLPPLDPFSKINYTLDDWQLEVFNKISNKKNILICAPTSAGKTVCSTYCAILGNKTIFVVPSDELARQVGGIFRNMEGITVKIVTNKEYFPKDVDIENEKFNLNNNFKVLVGTPRRIEEYLTINGSNGFDYAIFDEWHMLNSNEGASLENIFKFIECPFLALSATLDSPETLVNWMEEIKGQDVNLVTYNRRFIIQQRYLYTQNNLKHLHPLSCVDLEFLKSNEFLTCNLSFTPRDSYDLFEKINGKILSNELHPRNVLNKDIWDRISLNDTLQYEKEIKLYLHNLAKSDSILANNILNEYKNESITEDSKYDYIKLIKILIKKNMCPAIFFKVNPKECLVLFKEIVQSLHDHQNIKYPHHYDDLEFKYDYFIKMEKEKEDTRKKASIPQDKDPQTYLHDLDKKIEDRLLEEMKDKFQLLIEKRITKINESNISQNKKDFYVKYYNKEIENVLNLKYLNYIDKNRPHPEFCFNNQMIDSGMMRQIRRDIKNMTGEVIDYTHPFMIGIERGIVPYFKDMEVPYQRIAQSLFSQKKIPIVISDESLAYGINLPIKTVVMIGNQGKEIDPVIASQMSGRSGRRGIDREGNIIYINLNWENVLRGKYTKLEGKNPSGYYLSLPYYFKKTNMSKSDENILKRQTQNLFNRTLFNFANNLSYNSSLEMKKSLNVIKTYELRDPINSFIAWSLRFFGVNTIHTIKLINIIKDYSDEYEIFEIIASLIDNKSTEFNENNKISNIFKNLEVGLYNGKYLLDVYKKKKISNSDDIDRLKVIANFVSIIYTILSSDLKTEDNNKFNLEYSNLVKKLKVIFDNLKNIIKKSLF